MGALIAGCASDTHELASEEAASPPAEAAPAQTQPPPTSSPSPTRIPTTEPEDYLDGASLCLFDPQELTEAYAPLSDFVAGPPEVISEWGRERCRYGNEQSDTTTTPWSVSIEGRVWGDPSVQVFLQLLEYPGMEDPDRADLAKLFCEEGYVPPALGDESVCEQGEDADVIVFDSAVGVVLRDEGVYLILSSGVEVPTVPWQRDGMLALSLLAGERPLAI